MKVLIGTLFMLLSMHSFGYTMCPDGNYYPDGQCQINPNGTWRTAPNSNLAPNGTYVPEYGSQPQQGLGQQMYNMGSSYDPYGAFKRGQMAPQQYQLQQQQLDLQQQELEIRRLELLKRQRQLQQ
jgi:hypothetical protein